MRQSTEQEIGLNAIGDGTDAANEPTIKASHTTSAGGPTRKATAGVSGILTEHVPQLRAQT
jgi:hypothetical protein